MYMENNDAGDEYNDDTSDNVNNHHRFYYVNCQTHLEMF